MSLNKSKVTNLSFINFQASDQTYKHQICDPDPRTSYCKFLLSFMSIVMSLPLYYLHIPTTFVLWITQRLITTSYHCNPWY